MNSLQFFANKRRADTGLLHAILKSFSPHPFLVLLVHTWGNYVLQEKVLEGTDILGMRIQKKILELIPFFPPFCKRRSLC
uniref:Uncharacterized protein n=1 Tax=Theropithecus gelada TaxID=9565 RepID=A0A8D2F6M9_THEGE